MGNITNSTRIKKMPDLNTPTISVVLPVYGEEPYLQESIDSILSQSYDDFNLIIIKEELSNDTAQILDQVRDERVMKVKSNRSGLPAARNVGINIAEGKFIAFMDADDIAHKNRFQTQVNFLNEYPEIGIVGSSYYRIDRAGERMRRVNPPETDTEIRWKLLLHSCLPQPTVMMERDVLIENDLRYRTFPAEDYDLWTRVIKHTKASNIQKPLLSYRVNHNEQISSKYNDLQNKKGSQISYNTINKTFPETNYSINEVREMRGLIVKRSKDEVDMIRAGENYLRLLDAFCDAEPNVNHVIKEATSQLVRILLKPPIKLGGGNLILESLSRNPTLPIHIANYLFHNPRSILLHTTRSP